MVNMLKKLSDMLKYSYLMDTMIAVKKKFLGIKYRIMVA